ncbi:MAG: acyl transferase [Bacteroidetes bacterium]|nr:acyl transferase [Bacteroidota bacterium]MBS1648147.1 acyl transferase [Bacteroidota bacterium]
MIAEQELINSIFNIQHNFNQVAHSVFSFQYQNNKIYRQWCSLMQPEIVNTQFQLFTVPFLPISFFKTHTVTSTNFIPQQIFESSGTTTTINSQHLVKNINIYKTSFIKTFETFYGQINEWCVIGLLPSYLERNNSSLVMMVDEMIKLSNNAYSGFYLNEFDKLKTVLTELENKKQKTLLIGVTFGLLDFAEKNKMQLNHTIVMETGGMKGRKKELTRNEVHNFLKENLGVKEVHSEYGMTELLSQAYSKNNGKFICPPYMKVVVRSEEDPLQINFSGKGILNIIDLANIYSCSFIATDDAGIVYEDGSFEVIGRVDSSDIRGCSLLAI